MEAYQVRPGACNNGCTDIVAAFFPPPDLIAGRVEAAEDEKRPPSLGTSSAGDPCVDLHAELWRAMRFARHAKVEPMLEALQLPRKVQWGLAPIEYLAGGRRFYVPRSDAPAFALIVPVVEFGDTVDLASILLPSLQVANRIGIGKALGLDAIDAARWNGTDLQLVDSPLAWMRDPDDRAFIVDWKIAAFTLADVSSISCNSLGLAMRVEGAFLRPRPVPELLVVT